MHPMQQGDVPKTYADINNLVEDYKYSPNTNIRAGIKNFINWFLKYNKTK